MAGWFAEFLFIGHVAELLAKRKSRFVLASHLGGVKVAFEERTERSAGTARSREDAPISRSTRHARRHQRVNRGDRLLVAYIVAVYVMCVVAVVVLWLWRLGG
jgi:hypothetical protein